MPSFNLVDEKWIPCILPDGKHEDFSLKDVLIRAHKIKEIVDPSPLVTVSLHRLLLAILHRNFGPANIGAWQEIWKTNNFDEKRLTDYLQKWRARFNLFDEARPFYQTLELENAEMHPILHLAMGAASGNNATLFDHNSDNEPRAVSPAIAARYLIATQCYAIGLGKSRPFYFSDSPLIRGLTAMVFGNSLFETLTLNVIEYNEELPFPHSGEDLPIWEQEKPAEPNRGGTPIKGYLDYLTWQSRSIHLYPQGEPPLVKECQILQNLKLPKQQYLDPFKCFRVVEDKGYLPLPVSPDEAVWRDSHVLFQKIDARFKRPEIFNWLARIEEKRRCGEIRAQPIYSLTATGLATDRGKAASVLLWRHERLPLPLSYLKDENLLGKLKDALEIAEKVGRELDRSAWNLAKLTIAPEAERLNKNQRKGVENLTDQLSIARPYWAQLGQSFNRLLTDLAEDRTEDDGEIIYGQNVLPWWAEEVRQSARLAFREATSSLDRTGRMLKAVTIAEDSFNRSLKSLIKDFVEPYQKSGEKGGEA